LQVRVLPPLYKTNGKLDPSFGNGGRVVTKIGGSSGASALVVQRDGKLIVAGQQGLRRHPLHQQRPT
jgi:hypothetical protein